MLMLRQSISLALVTEVDVARTSMTPGQPCEARTLGRLNVLRRELIDPAIAAHSGRIVKLMGDGALVEFASAVDVSPVRSRSRDSFESTTPLALKAIQSGFGSD
jgi:class 3 adenylate cyclase